MRNVRTESGFSMIEAIIAIAITGTMITSLLFLSERGSQAISKRLEFSHAMNIAQNFSESILVNSGPASQLTEGTHGPLYFDSSGASLQAAGGTRLDWTVTSNSPIQNVMRVDIQASWNSGATSNSLDLTVYRSMPTATGSGGSVSASIPSPTPGVTNPYSWLALGYGACGTPTATTKTREVKCHDDVNGGFVDDSFCSISTKPSTVGNCSTYAWSAGAWSTTCNSSSDVHTRTVTCLLNGTTVVADSYCVSATKPTETESCSACYPMCS